MNLLTAIIRPEKLDDAMTAVTDAGIGGLMFTEVRGFGKQYGHIDPADRLAERRVLILSKLRLDLVARDEAAEPVARAIAKAVGVGEIGDGKMWVAPVGSVLRIRAGEWRRALPVNPDLGRYPVVNEFRPTRFSRFMPVRGATSSFRRSRRLARQRRPRHWPAGPGNTFAGCCSARRWMLVPSRWSGCAS